MPSGMTSELSGAQRRQKNAGSVACARASRKPDHGARVASAVVSACSGWLGGRMRATCALLSDSRRLGSEARAVGRPLRCALLFPTTVGIVKMWKPRGEVRNAIRATFPIRLRHKHRNGERVIVGTGAQRELGKRSGQAVA